MRKRDNDALAEAIAERDALRLEVRLLTLALYRESRARREAEERLAQLVDTELEGRE